MEHSFKAMGGEFRLMCFPQNYLSREDVRCLFVQAQKETERIEDKFTEFRESPFNEINDQAGVSPVAVDDEIWDVIQKSLSLSRESNGLFDISHACIGHLWRKQRQKGKILSMEERENLRKFIDYKKIHLDEKKRTVFLPHKKMRIGLGGVGKGYAIDKIFDLLEHHGLYNFYVNGSGDIRVHSHGNAPRPWRIGIKNPFSPDKSIGILHLSNGSVASSGGYIKKNHFNHTFVDHHILDPSRGGSRSDLLAATVIAKDAVTSDTTATILMNLSAHQATKYLDDMDLMGFVVDESGKVHLSSKALKRFVSITFPKGLIGRPYGTD